MSSEVDPKGLEAARTAYDAARMEWERPLMHTNPDPLAAAIQAYLSASPSIGRVGVVTDEAMEIATAAYIKAEHEFMHGGANAPEPLRVAINAVLSTLVYHEEPAGDTQGAELEAVAKYICETILNTKWETLPEGRITARGFKPIIYSEYGGMKFQGDRGDLLDFATHIAALVSPPDNGEPGNG